jgi:hypothetical protein
VLTLERIPAVKQRDWPLGPGVVSFGEDLSQVRTGAAPQVLYREIASLPADEQNAGGALLDALERERTTARAATRRHGGCRTTTEIRDVRRCDRMAG